MGYIMELRKIVGHRRLLMPGAGVFLVKDGMVLLQRRKDNGLWGDHGGSVEMGETVEETARRELTEETGLVAGEMEMLGIYSGSRMNYTYPNGDEVSILGVYYVCSDFSGEWKIQPDEVTELKWFPLDALPPEAEISPITGVPLKDLVEKYRQNREEGKGL